METWRSMAKHLEDLEVMKELLKEDDDEAALEEFRELLGQVDTTLGKLEFARMISAP